MKMQVRRYLSVLLVIALVLSLSVGVFAAGTSQLSLALSGECYSQGDAQILVNADTAGTVSNGKLVVTYDAAALHYEGAEVGTAWPEGSDVSLQVNAVSGKLIIAFAGAYEAGQGDVIQLNFTVLTEGTSTVTMTDAYAGGTSELEVTAQCPSAPYTDVIQTKWYHEGIDYVIIKGYMNGISPDKFAPGASTTRAMLITVLYRIAGEPSVEGMTAPFTDVTQSWCKNAVVWAYNSGIANGTSATTFGPNEPLTREHTAAFLYRYAEKMGANMNIRGDLSVFNDGAKVRPWAVEYVSWAVGVGLLGNASSNADVMLLSPQGYAIRAQLAKILRDFDLKVLK